MLSSTREDCHLVRVHSHKTLKIASTQWETTTGVITHRAKAHVRRGPKPWWFEYASSESSPSSLGSSKSFFLHSDYFKIESSWFHLASSLVCFVVFRFFVVLIRNLSVVLILQWGGIRNKIYTTTCLWTKQTGSCCSPDVQNLYIFCERIDGTWIAFCWKLVFHLNENLCHDQWSSIYYSIFYFYLKCLFHKI